MAFWNYADLDIGSSAFDLPYAYCGGNYLCQNDQNIPER